jgi:sarcosine oxidase subunit alpha
MLLRTEKAFIAAGLEGDGYANIYDVGLGWVVNNKKGDFIGKRSTERDLSIGGDRPEVVGLKIENKSLVAPKGCPIVDPNMEGAKKMEGMVTIGFFSPNLNESIALAQLKNGRARMGEQVILYTKEQELRATVCDPIFIDPRGERMRS